MNKDEEIYIEKISNELTVIPAKHKEDIVKEIRSHIYEATSEGESVSIVIKNLGDPKKLANSYIRTYRLTNNKLTVLDVFKNIGFYSSVALSGIFIIPFLALAALAFVLSSVVLIGGSLLNLFKVTNQPFVFGALEVYGPMQIVIAVIFSLVLCLLAFLCWKGLKKYLTFVSSKYYEIRVGKR